MQGSLEWTEVLSDIRELKAECEILVRFVTALDNAEEDNDLGVVTAADKLTILAATPVYMA